MVLSRHGSETRKFGLKGVDKGKTYHHKKLIKLTFRARFGHFQTDEEMVDADDSSVSFHQSEAGSDLLGKQLGRLWAS